MIMMEHLPLSPVRHMWAYRCHGLVAVAAWPCVYSRCAGEQQSWPLRVAVEGLRQTGRSHFRQNWRELIALMVEVPEHPLYGAEIAVGAITRVASCAGLDTAQNKLRIAFKSR